jgi:hypothetical protein
MRAWLEQRRVGAGPRGYQVVTGWLSPEDCPTAAAPAGRQHQRTGADPGLPGCGYHATRYAADPTTPPPAGATWPTPMPWRLSDPNAPDPVAAAFDAAGP